MATTGTRPGPLCSVVESGPAKPALTKAYGTQTLFADVDLAIHQGERIGLIGPNGSGKSTLLKILSGQEEPDSGQVKRGRHVAVAYLSQDDQFDDSATIMQNLLHALEQENTVSGVEKEARVRTLLSKAEFSDPEQKVGTLSGGWRKRLAICRALSFEAELLVLDEPTNHLDIQGILWLEKFLLAAHGNGPAAFVLVSHDRQFIENCANRVVELSPVYPRGTLQVLGRYSDFLDAREQFIEQQQQTEEKLRNKVRKETEWLRRGPKARSTKARYRVDQAYRLQEELDEVRGRTSLEKNIGIDFSATGRRTKKLLEGKGLCKKLGEKLLFRDLDILLSPGTRLGLLGPNGCGKSSLMGVLSQDPETVINGELRLAKGVEVVYFEQHRQRLDGTLPLRRALAPEGDSILFKGRSLHVVSWAKRFLFRVEQLDTPVEQLSGGEQARIVLAQLMRTPADILLLDEPTNDLDIASLDVLEESLRDFEGAVVLVTHDRYLLDRLCDQVLGFDGMGGVSYYADYLQYLAAVEGRSERDRDTGSNSGGAKGKAKSSRGRANRLSYLDQREYDQMELLILAAEEEVEGLEAQLVSEETSSDPEALAQVWHLLEEGRRKVEELYTRWAELEEKKISSN
ncbi:unnamed protein product [Cyprideis torosa]|uniref:Uncharacterized protein n=1 Tax=Cyprideis torosa TaxID=163714 RepID=A0A7R8WQH1_9CRUS|nr:unnamed protein product [Cyprideis torosa]CAG0902503.1 unnamed protein product [Cyprideis torosa]